MKTVTLTITEDLASVLSWAIRDVVILRTPVREYVDKRYSSMSDSFRNRKIGEVQERIDRLERLQKKISSMLLDEDRTND